MKNKYLEQIADELLYMITIFFTVSVSVFYINISIMSCMLNRSGVICVFLFRQYMLLTKSMYELHY